MLFANVISESDDAFACSASLASFGWQASLEQSDICPKSNAKAARRSAWAKEGRMFEYPIAMHYVYILESVREPNQKYLCPNSNAKAARRSSAA